MTGVSSLGQALSQIALIKKQQAQFNTLSTQLTTGKKAQLFSGLGTDVLISKRARAEFNALETYNKNIINGDRRIKLMLNAVEEFKKQAESFADILSNFAQEADQQQGEIIYYDDPLTPEDDQIAVGMTSADPSVEFASMRDFAKNVMRLFEDLLNSKDGERYLLGGADTQTKPIGSTSTLSSAISSLLSSWKDGTISTENLLRDFTDRTATSGNANALTDTIIGYSSALSGGTVGSVYVRVDDTTEIDFTALANDSSFRDILVACAALASDDLGPIIDTFIPPNSYPGTPDVQGAPGSTVGEMKENFFKLYNHLNQMVAGAIDKIDAVRFKLEGARARMDEVKKSHIDQKNLLLTTIGDVEDVDTNEVAVRIQQLTIQLDASFSVTAKLQDLTLTNYLLFN